MGQSMKEHSFLDEGNLNVFQISRNVKLPFEVNVDLGFTLNSTCLKYMLPFISVRGLDDLPHQSYAEIESPRERMQIAEATLLL